MSRREERWAKPRVDDLLRSLAAKEEAFLAEPFLAPVVRGGVVRVRIAQVVCRLQVEPRDFVGWGVFEPMSHSAARLARPATLAERREYLRLFPLLRLVLCRRTNDGWRASTASFGDRRVRLDGLAPVMLVEEAEQFDTVCVRYDGGAFWFDEVDPRRDPGAAAYLREALAGNTAPEDLSRKGITAEERAAYEVNYWALHRPAEEQPQAEQRPAARATPAARRRARRDAPEAVDEVGRRLAENLSHAGAELIAYLERGDGYRVTYMVDRQRYTSSVDKDNLTVQVAGICLSGEDHRFDLASLVGVLREGEGEHGLFRVGDGGIDEEHDWQVHPRRRP